MAKKPGKMDRNGRGGRREVEKTKIRKERGNKMEKADNKLMNISGNEIDRKEQRYD